MDCLPCILQIQGVSKFIIIIITILLAPKRAFQQVITNNLYATNNIYTPTNIHTYIQTQIKML